MKKLLVLLLISVQLSSINGFANPGDPDLEAGIEGNSGTDSLESLELDLGINTSDQSSLSRRRLLQAAIGTLVVAGVVAVPLTAAYLNTSDGENNSTTQPRILRGCQEYIDTINAKVQVIWNLCNNLVGVKDYLLSSMKEAGFDNSTLSFVEEKLVFNPFWGNFFTTCSNLNGDSTLRPDPLLTIASAAYVVHQIGDKLPSGIKLSLQQVLNAAKGDHPKSWWRTLFFSDEVTTPDGQKLIEWEKPTSCTYSYLGSLRSGFARFCKPIHNWMAK